MRNLQTTLPILFALSLCLLGAGCSQPTETPAPVQERPYEYQRVAGDQRNLIGSWEDNDGKSYTFNRDGSYEVERYEMYKQGTFKVLREEMHQEGGAFGTRYRVQDASDEMVEGEKIEWRGPEGYYNFTRTNGFVVALIEQDAASASADISFVEITFSEDHQRANIDIIASSLRDQWTELIGY